MLLLLSQYLAQQQLTTRQAAQSVSFFGQSLACPANGQLEAEVKHL
jgi:hypothetical protein